MNLWRVRSENAAGKNPKDAKPESQREWTLDQTDHTLEIKQNFEDAQSSPYFSPDPKRSLEALKLRRGMRTDLVSAVTITVSDEDPRQIQIDKDDTINASELIFKKNLDQTLTPDKQDVKSTVRLSPFFVFNLQQPTRAKHNENFKKAKGFSADYLDYQTVAKYSRELNEALATNSPADLDQVSKVCAEIWKEVKSRYEYIPPKQSSQRKDDSNKRECYESRDDYDEETDGRKQSVRLKMTVDAPPSTGPDVQKVEIKDSATSANDHSAESPIIVPMEIESTEDTPNDEAQNDAEKAVLDIINRLIEAFNSKALIKTRGVLSVGANKYALVKRRLVVKMDVPTSEAAAPS